MNTCSSGMRLIGAPVGMSKLALDLLDEGGQLLLRLIPIVVHPQLVGTQRVDLDIDDVFAVRRQRPVILRSLDRGAQGLLGSENLVLSFLRRTASSVWFRSAWPDREEVRAEREMGQTEDASRTSRSCSSGGRRPASASGAHAAAWSQALEPLSTSWTVMSPETSLTRPPEKGCLLRAALRTPSCCSYLSAASGSFRDRP